MESNNLKTKVASGLFWRFAERILAQGVTFIVTIVLARLLEPEAYGAIAIVNIFIVLANVFVDSGMGNSLIQKKDADETDFSSVFYFNIFSGVLIYIVIFLIAPFIADFYEMQVLCPVLRVMALKLILAGINSVQHAYVSRKMIFKRFFWATLGGTVGSAFFGIAMALWGFGIWALVGQYMFNSVIDTLILWLTVKWRPKKLFSLKRLRSLFSYGWKILIASLLRSGYKEVRSLVIGKVYTSTDLAHYTKGKSFPSLFVNNLYTAVKSVIFPTMAQIQDKKAQLKAMTRRLVRVYGYVLSPLLIGLILVAYPLVELLLTKKWLPCVPYLQATCILFLLEPIQIANLQAIKALGRSDAFLKLEIIKKTLGFIALVITVKYGVWAIVVGEIFIEIIAAVINILPVKKMLGYGYKEQLADIFSSAIPLTAMIISVLLVKKLAFGVLPQLIIQTLVGAGVFILASVLTKDESFEYLKGLFKNTVLNKLRR